MCTCVYVCKLRYECIYMGEEEGVWVCVYIVFACVYTWVYVCKLRNVWMYMVDEEVK